MAIQSDANTVFAQAKSLLRFIAAHIELFLIFVLIMVAAIQYYVRPQSQSYDEIISSGSLRVLIADEPDSQYVFNKQHYGFEYELLATFARSLQVELELIVVPYGELFTMLDAGAGDIAVGGILDTEFVRKVSQPTVSWFQAKTTVVYKRGTPKPESLEDLNAESVLSSSRYFGLYDFDSVQLSDDHRSEYDLLTAVAIGHDRFALTTDYRARNAKHYLPELNRSFILPDTVGLVWALPKQADDKLLAVLNYFLQTAVEQKLPEKLENYYLGLPTRLTTFDALSIHDSIKDKLPEYETLFRAAARKTGVDWTLLAAMAYQESRWSNDAKSPTGVRGIMQLTNDTADFLEVEDLLDVNQSIEAAASYIVYLKSKLPDAIQEPERTWFAVGAYNIGLRHILAAYRIARDKGLESTHWNTISQLLPTLYGEPYRKGEEVKNYVVRVQIFTDILRFYDSHQREQETSEESSEFASYSNNLN